MPKRKSYARPSRPFKRRRLFQKRRSKRGRNAVPRVLRSLVERKIYGTSGTDADVGTNGHFMYINAPLVQGDQVTQREGRKVTFTNMQFRGILQGTGASTDYTDRYVRFIVFIDKTPNQETMAVNDLLNTPADPITSYRTWNESFRYKVLKDVTHKLSMRRQLDPATSVESNICGSKLVKITIPMKMSSEWLSTTGGTDQITRNSLCVLAISSHSTSNVGLDWFSRCTFVDL